MLVWVYVCGAFYKMSRINKSKAALSVKVVEATDDFDDFELTASAILVLQYQ
jgi:hypothetical protein